MKLTISLFKIYIYTLSNNKQVNNSNSDFQTQNATIEITSVQTNTSLLLVKFLFVLYLKTMSH